MKRKKRKILDLQVEQKFWRRGTRAIIGLDEAGMGPLAGPVCAGAVCIAPGFTPSTEPLALVYDSKKLSPVQRESIYKAFVKDPRVRFATGTVSVRVIDRINIRNAGRLAMERAAAKLGWKHDIALESAAAVIDGTVTLSDFPGIQESIVKGDQKIYSVAAASIIAKVTRDRIMGRLHKKYPHYGFAQHKGYGTRGHYRALKRHGASPEHRKTFLKDM